MPFTDYDPRECAEQDERDDLRREFAQEAHDDSRSDDVLDAGEPEGVTAGDPCDVERVLTAEQIHEAAILDEEAARETAIRHDEWLHEFREGEAA